MERFASRLFSLDVRVKAGRDQLVDFLRGGAMLLVLLHHAGSPLGDLILSFHMPLLFILSGYVERAYGNPGGTLGGYARRRFVRLVVPYFAFEALNLLLWCLKCAVKGQPVPLADGIVSIVTCVNNGYVGLYGRLWFLPCMFVADVYVWLVLHSACGRTGLSRAVSACLLLAASLVTSKVLAFRLPFAADTALFAAAFVLIGYSFSDVVGGLASGGEGAWKAALAALSALYVAYAVRYAGAAVLMYINSYGEYTTSVCAALAGSAAFLVVVGCAHRLLPGEGLLCRLVRWYGVNSLATFPVHLTIKMFVLWCVPALSSWCALFAVMLLANIPVVNFITRYMPFMLGDVGRLATKREAQHQ